MREPMQQATIVRWPIRVLTWLWIAARRILAEAGELVADRVAEGRQEPTVR